MFDRIGRFGRPLWFGRIRPTANRKGDLADGRQEYRDYHLVLEFRWGGDTLGVRKEKARDTGILVHGIGPDGGYKGIWQASIEANVIEANVVNGVVVNEAFDVHPNEGKITLQTEMAEVYVRQWELWPLGKAPGYHADDNR